MVSRLCLIIRGLGTISEIFSPVACTISNFGIKGIVRDQNLLVVLTTPQHEIMVSANTHGFCHDSTSLHSITYTYFLMLCMSLNLILFLLT